MMPELPEVETTRRGIYPLMCHLKIIKCSVYQPRLRWPIPENFSAVVEGEVVSEIERRGKYLVIKLNSGKSFLVHLGMSGSLRVCDESEALRKHDHVCFNMETGQDVRYHDPRRFGCILLAPEDPMLHPLLSKLGPEPLSEHFTASYLYQKALKRQCPIKQLIMNAGVVVGVGNIYANEALFMCRIRPTRLASKVSAKRIEALVAAIKKVLNSAIEQGGTTLRDFVSGSGEPGYFQQQLLVYGREGQSCHNCGSTLKGVRIGQRTTVYCGSCQR